ncbi:MerR family transcriptional regulator [Bacillus paralicheniformis]|uniref:MerR family transcriptional regulator n=1 Tax=Bacillus paralicheniformis TaxID=1648923 RepID=UPI002DB6DC34|nr:MerR family transcriptional regulator [Bacillus paralicheniformis]MEC1023075.1 MerR family transcriptional regulator [Bacillus paralicheniformis]MEC1025650.1 MerR family transcriptional regulator [Bacillus paralicheniformis]MEC1035571.1 MerR family transcriptional regulator [Bacillus paralicheniformis]MEC1051563.1 MerR family transcriptional regulator [Bacillus paralicheniformis]MEC1059133.1 MerR family transcriptional regulator [Bacillus paralicheniformis]
MEKDGYYSIGVFSKMTGTSVRTLHYYDEIGLLKPEKQPGTGRRFYTDRDARDLQKITCFKFLGYSLEQIRAFMKDACFDAGLIEALQKQKKALEEKKEHIETGLKAINRTIGLLEEEEEIDSSVFMSLLNSIQTEKEQRIWLEQQVSKRFADDVFGKSEDEMAKLDQEYIRLSKEAKRLMGKPVDDPEVQEMADRYMKTSLEFIGEDVLSALGQMETIESQQLAEKFSSPFTKEEEAWLQQVFEYYMIHNDFCPEDGR